MFSVHTHNVLTKCIQMLIESYMWLLADIFCIFKFSHQQRCHLPFYFASLRANLFIYKKVDRWIYFIDLFSINLIYVNFNIYYIFLFIFFQNVFFDILSTKIQFIFINFLFSYFLAKKAVKLISSNIDNNNISI